MIRKPLYTALAIIIITGSASQLAVAQQGLTNRGGAAGGTTTVGGGQGLNNAVEFSDVGENFGSVGTTQGETATTRTQGSQLGNQMGAGGTTTGTSTNRGFGQAGGGFGGRGGNAARNAFNPFTQQGSTSQMIRPSLRIGFVLIPRPRGEVSQNVTKRITALSSRVTSLSTRSQFVGLSATVDDAGLVTLDGFVTSNSAKRLAGFILKMEPGVRKIKNNLVVKELAKR